MSTKTRMMAFDAFTKTLCLLEQQDSVLYTWNRNRLALTHAVAMHLHGILCADDESLSSDMGPSFSKSSKSLNPDVLVHDRSTDRNVLAVVCRTEYLTEEEQKGLLNLRRACPCDLVVAVSFLVQKNYMLIYVAEEDRLEYYHFERKSLTVQPFKTRITEKEMESKDQLKFNHIKD